MCVCMCEWGGGKGREKGITRATWTATYGHSTSSCQQTRLVAQGEREGVVMVMVVVVVNASAATRWCGRAPP